MKKRRNLFYCRGKMKLNAMKITLLLIVFSTMCFSAMAQNERFDIDVKQQKVEKLLELLKEKASVKFLYRSDLFKGTKKIDFTGKDVTVLEVIDKTIVPQGYSYEVKDGLIIFSKTKKDEPQGFSVKGKVTEGNGLPLPSATVLIKGTTKGTTTDANGNFAIKVPEGTVLVFSFMGFHKQEIAVSPEDLEINVVMQEAAMELGEVAVISTGYQLIKPEQSTGSIATMRAKEYDSRINTTDFLTSLENRIPGLLINNDIEFDGNSLFQIRGISTINGGKEPLIVIDGYPTELSLDMINPNEIESVTVLKDAAAATIYGVRSSNGVIVIERKKAKAGKPVVNFRATTAFTPKENYDRYRWDEDGSAIHLDFYRSYHGTNFPSYRWMYMTNPVYGAFMSGPPPYTILAREAAHVITPEQADQEFEELASYNNINDYGRLFLRTAVIQTYNLDVSGGNENASYYITANYTDSDLSEIKNDNSSFMLSGRSTINFSKRFSLELTTDFQKIKSSSVSVPGVNSAYPYERFEDENGNPLSIFNGSCGTTYYNEALMAIGLLDNMYYPLVDINEVSDKTHTLNNRITANFHYDIGNGFSLHFGGVYENSHTDIKHLASENSSEVHQYINHYILDTPDGLVSQIPEGSFLRQQISSREGYTLRAQMNYDKQINKNHSLNLIFGGEVRNVLDKSSLTAYFGYSDQTLLHQPVNYEALEVGSYAGNNPTVSYDNLFKQGYVDDRYVSVYSNVVYAYKGKYSFTGSFRIDQSNLFGTNPKYQYKPLFSLGAGWNIHKENFMQNTEWVKSLKLRMAYGFNGNVAKNALPRVIAYDALNYLTSSEIFSMLTLSTPANSGLRWEQTYNFNVGLDYSIFKIITGSIDYYVKKSTDILASNPIDITKVGKPSAIINQASIRNTGLEITLHADWITRKNFNWNTGLVFSCNKSKVLKVYHPGVYEDRFTSYLGSPSYLEGYAVGAMFTCRYAGLNSEGKLLIYDENGEAQEFDYGYPKSYVDYAGSSIPSVNIGLSNRVDIGNFYAYCMFNFYGGFKVRAEAPDPGDGRPLEGAGNYWKEPGDEADPDKLPSISTTAYSRGYEYLDASDKYTVSGAYLTLGDLTASYSFRNSKLIKRIGLSNLELRAQASNLFTVGFNKYNYSVATGSYAKSYLTPTYTVGLYVNF